ncbi:metal-dependent hydrolase [Pseudomonas matsuisoli]|uniref:Integral membrane protein n=1 Tax=Pseudomonas matsuisoli TaxID=1515666 RepID=A0A917PRL9_9PSED|nr:metal-dependent hydrolase [Pseudomonas matsuisoli]GGJ88835.1 integral membrane protein [Pseudomonas matsuisoli]
MDSITQAVLGATIQGALLGRWQGRKALVYGAALATLPDLDVVIDYGDAVAQMTYHRGFSHSLFVLSALALALTGLLRLRPNPGYSAGRLFITLWLVLITHPLLDTFTSYGTQLLWPLTTPPIAWSTLFIIDPLYTVPLILAVVVGLISGLKDKTPRGPIAALTISSLYIAFSVSGKWMAEHRVEQQLSAQGIQVEAVFSAPTPLNTLLWRVTVMAGDQYYESMVSWFDTQPPALQAMPSGKQLSHVLQDSPQWHRLAWFTSNILRYDEVNGRLLVTDLRLGMTGFHPFRFPMAQRDENGEWTLIGYVEREPTYRGGAEQLRMIWNRIWAQSPELPLRSWAAPMGPNATAHREG